MSAAARPEGDPGEVERLRDLVHDLGEAVTTLTRRQAAWEQFFEILGEPRHSAPEDKPLSAYDAAAAVQAKRRGLHLAGGTAVRR
jgi:hypothetical protein